MEEIDKVIKTSSFLKRGLMVYVSILLISMIVLFLVKYPSSSKGLVIKDQRSLLLVSIRSADRVKLYHERFVRVTDGSGKQRVYKMIGNNKLQDSIYNFSAIAGSTDANFIPGSVLHIETAPRNLFYVLFVR